MEIIRPASTRAPAPAKLRILETANVLFYKNGIHTMGVDRLISASSVTKATFYKHFGSKDRLIVDYVEHRHRLAVEWLADIVEALDDPAKILRRLQDDILSSIADPDFRGCAFLNAAAEFPDAAHPVRQAVRRHRDWYLDVIEQLLRQLELPMPGDAADDLMLARDGAMAGAYAGDPIASTAALLRAFDRATSAVRNPVVA